ncbi:MAG: hypothetical protein ACK5LR_06315, partial [Mangrovibacterium sp.]
MNPYAPDETMSGMEFVMVELPKFKPDTYSQKRMAVLWLRFLTVVNDEMEVAPEGLEENPEIRDALSLIQRSQYSESQMSHYNEFWDIISNEVT